MAGTTVDGITKIGGWKAESIAKHLVGSTTSAGVRASKKTRDHEHVRANELPLPQAFESDFSACAKKYV